MIFLFLSELQLQHSLFIDPVHNGDMSADRSGARLPDWPQRQVVFIVSQEVLCPVAEETAEWKRDLWGSHLNADGVIKMWIMEF